MTLEQYAFLAEIIGSTTVVVSLIFVGVQLGHANRESRALTMQAAMFREIENAFRFADHASTWDKVVTGAPLSEGEDLRRGILLYNAFMTDTHYRYQQFRAGYLDSRTWEARVASLPFLVSVPMYSIWRDSPGGRNHAEDFLEFLDKLKSEATN